MRCDLHVHSIASGMCDTPGLTRIAKESYNHPAEVYHRCKRLGMSIVTLTDHDSIDGAEALRKYPDFFLSEEVTVRMPTGTQIHLGVYGITEKDHAEISRRRNDFIALLMYLTERKIFFSLNHVFSSLTGRRETEDFDWFASYVPAFEVRNGQMWKDADHQAQQLAAKLGKAGVAGGDCHTPSVRALASSEVTARAKGEAYSPGRRNLGRDV